MMSSDGEQTTGNGSEIDAAIERALESANLRPGDAATTSAFVVKEHEPSAAEAGDGVGAGVGDGD
jgi:hypothetical protein